MKSRGFAMSDLDKINIYVPEHIGVVLDNDAELFEVFKKDRRTINRNHFLSMLILGYHNAYVTECQQTFEKIADELIESGIESTSSYEIADKILKNVVLPEVPSRKGKNPSKLSLKPTKETEGLILSIMNDLVGDDFISQYFCRMLMSYCEKPISERERIIFRSNCEMLQNASKEARPLTFSTIWNPKVIHTVVPYRLATGQEEMFNYLLCAEINPETRKQEAKVYRLNRIARINYSRASNQIDNDVQEYLNRMLRYGPQYIINDNDESCVRLTESGRKNFSRIYYGRPQVDRIEEKEDGYYYYFKGSKDQVFFYFRRFGFDDVEIISPTVLRQKMSDFHRKAYENYR